MTEPAIGPRSEDGAIESALFHDLIRISIEAIESADFLTAEQKRDILYNNSARFIRLDAQKPSPK